MMTLEEAIKHAEAQAAEAEGECAKEHQQLADWLGELVQGRKRIEELAGMLNKQHQAAQLQVEDERDACERAIQFLIDIAEGKEEGTSKRSDEVIGALKQALHVVQSRKDSGVRMVQEMAHGTMIGEYVQACVEDALAKERKAHDEA